MSLSSPTSVQSPFDVAGIHNSDTRGIPDTFNIAGGGGAVLWPNDLIIFSPYFVSRSTTYNKASIRKTDASTGNVSIGLYTVGDNGSPDQLIGGAVDQTLSVATGIHLVSFTTTLELVSGYIFICLKTSTSLTIDFVDVSNASCFVNGYDTSMSPIRGRYTTYSAGDMSLPTTAPTLTTDYGFSNKIGLVPA